MSASLLVINSALCVVLFGCDSPNQDFSPSPSPQESTQPFQSLIKPHDHHTPHPGQSCHKIPRIVAFGNSLTAGLGVSQDQSYPAQLQRRLDQAGYRYRVINAGVSGDTTAGGLRRLAWVLKSNPTIVILELGANDGLRGHRLEETFANLEQLIQGLQAAGVTVMLAGMKIPPNYGLDYTTTFSDMYRKLATSYNVTLMPFFLEGIATRPELNQSDGLHPTAEGYHILVNNLLPILTPLLQNRSADTSASHFPDCPH